MYIFSDCMWLCKHPMDLRRGSLGWMMRWNQHWRFWLHLSQLPVICKLYSTLYSVSIHYKNLQHHLRRAAKLPSTNVTGKCSWILQHTGFVIMNYSLKCAMHKDLSQQTNCISTAAASAISHNTIVVLVQVCWPLTILIWQVFRA